MRHLFLALPLLVLPMLVHGQTGIPAGPPPIDLYIYGTVKDLATADSLPGAWVRLREWPAEQELLQLPTDARGRYALTLNKEGVFRLEYGLTGMVGKCVEIDLTGTPDSVWAGGLGMQIDMTLLQRDPDIDYSILDEPIGKARYSAQTGLLEWDLAYTEGRQQRVLELTKADQERKSGKQ